VFQTVNMTVNISDDKVQNDFLNATAVIRCALIAYYVILFTLENLWHLHAYINILLTLIYRALIYMVYKSEPAEKNAMKGCTQSSFFGILLELKALIPYFRNHNMIDYN
jgi:hypothetical protein